jgi:putative transposase
MPYYERNLPHWLPTGKSLRNLAFERSLPIAIIEQLKSKKLATDGERFLEFDTHLDAHAFGPVWLKQPQIAGLVIAALKVVEEERLCRLHAYVVMPNHVHVLLTAIAALERITFLIKGRAARQANLLLGRTGKPFWQNESFDHWIRNPGEFERVLNYVKRNPVKIRLGGKSERMAMVKCQ